MATENFTLLPKLTCPLVLAELRAAGVMARTTLLCFDQRILQLAHQQVPELATCLLVEDQRPWAASLKELGFIPTTLGPDFVGVSTAAVHSLRNDFPGLRLVPWTVNDTAHIKAMINLGVDGITTDYPNRVFPLVGMV